MTMSMEITVDPRTVKATVDRLEPAEYDKRIEKAMDESLLYLKGLVQENTPVNLGLLRGGIFTEQRGVGVERHGLVSPSPATKEYAYVQELGRKPGSRMPPVDAILLWVRRKHLGGVYSTRTRRRMGSKATQASQDRSVAFLIARSIGRKGTPAHHMFQKAWIAGQARVQQIFVQRLHE